MKQTRNISPLDVLVLGAGLVFCFAFCIVYSAHRIMWSDELCGWMLLRDPSSATC